MEVGLIQNKSQLLTLSKKWEIVPFQEVLKDVSGNNKKIKLSETTKKGAIPVVDQGKNLICGFTNDIEATHKTEIPIIVFGDHTRIIKYIDFKFAMGADGTKVLKVIRPQTNTKYIFHYLKSLNIIDTGYNRHFKFIKDLVFPLPPLSEQQRIVKILDAADALRIKTQQIIDSYDELAHSIFLDMFGDAINNQKKWELTQFGKIYNSLRYGASTPPVYSESGIPFIRATNIKFGGVVKKGIVYISPHEASKIEKCTLSEGNLIIVRSGANTGDCGRIPAEFHGAFGGFDMIIEIDEPFSTFYNFLLNTPAGKAILKPYTRRAGQSHLNSQQMFELKVLNPPISLQNLFAEKIDLIEKQKELTQQSLKESEDLFQSLLQKAFKGELNN